jgi:hypothetical protein
LEASPAALTILATETFGDQCIPSALTLVPSASDRLLPSGAPPGTIEKGTT